MISAWGITDRGFVRKQNQDAFYFRITGKQSAWGIVCDGMGGAKAGEIASSMAVESFEACMEKHDAQTGAEENATILHQAVAEANEAVFFKASTNSECNGMGTTLVGVMIYKDRMWVVNVGDSRAYHIKKSGITRITRDHSVVEALVQKGNITPEQARQHPQKNLITRALGTSRVVRSDLYELPVEAGDYVLLCSDGLINEVTDQEILNEIFRCSSLEDCCRSLLKIALTRGAPDNITVVLFRM